MGKGFGFVTLLSLQTEVGEQKSDTIGQDRKKNWLLLLTCIFCGSSQPPDCLVP